MKQPKIIGLVLLAFAILMFVLNDFVTGAVALIAGILLFVSNFVYSKLAVKQFIASFKQVFFSVLIWDALFWLILAGIYWLFAVLVESAKAGLGLTDFSQAAVDSFVAAEQNVALLKGYLFTVTGYILLCLLVLLLAYTFFKGKSWLAIANKKSKFVFFKKFFLLSLFWYSAWLVLFLLVLAGVKPEASFYILAPLLFIFMHMTTVCCISFAQNNFVWQSVKKSFSIGFGKIHLFILPYAAALLVYLLLAKLLYLLPKTEVVLGFASIIVIIVWLAWFKVYIANILKNT